MQTMQHSRIIKSEWRSLLLRL